MRNLCKKCALVAAVFSVTLFQFGCFNLGGNWKLITAWLNEDIFG
jgi:hypothetical protein